MSAIGTAVLLKFDSLQSLENYIKSVYFSNYLMTLYFHVQFLKLKCTKNAKNTIKNESRKKTSPRTRKKCKELKRDIIKTQSQDSSIEKGNIRKNLNKKKNMKKGNIRKILGQKKEYEKKKYWENPKQKREYEKKQKQIYRQSPVKNKI